MVFEALFGGFLLHRSALLRRISTGFTSGSSSPRSCDARESIIARQSRNQNTPSELSAVSGQHSA
jgi:hypothetical protein